MTNFIPFDFGTWTAVEGRRCPKHGVQYGGPAFEVTEKGLAPLQREYCGFCLIEIFDAACPPLPPAGREPT